MLLTGVVVGVTLPLLLYSFLVVIGAARVGMGVAVAVPVLVRDLTQVCLSVRPLLVIIRVFVRVAFARHHRCVCPCGLCSSS